MVLLSVLILVHIFACTLCDPPIFVTNFTYLMNMKMSTCFSKVPYKAIVGYVRFEVFMAVTMKNVVFWDVTLCVGC
jgi:hypothetical protein